MCKRLSEKLAAVDAEDRMGRRVYYLRFKASDTRAAYYFVLIDAAKEKEFLKALNGTAIFNLEDFGRIVKSGYGEPSAELKQEMKRRYNIQYDDEP